MDAECGKWRTKVPKHSDKLGSGLQWLVTDFLLQMPQSGTLSTKTQVLLTFHWRVGAAPAPCGPGTPELYSVENGRRLHISQYESA